MKNLRIEEKVAILTTDAEGNQTLEIVEVTE